MKSFVEQFGSLKKFLHEVVTELKRCSWPTRRELVGSTIIVVISVIILGAFVGISDAALMGMLQTFFR